MERSFAMAAALAARLDALALATGHKIGLPLARRALAELAVERAPAATLYQLAG